MKILYPSFSESGVGWSGQRVFALHFFDFDSRKNADTLRILCGYFIYPGQVTLSHDCSDINWCGHAFRMPDIFLDNRLSLQCWITLLILDITVSNQLYMRNLIRYIRHFQFAIFFYQLRIDITDEIRTNSVFQPWIVRRMSSQVS